MKFGGWFLNRNLSVNQDKRGTVMTTLYIDRKSLTLRADGDALVFYEQGERTATVPLRILERVCMRGDLMLSAKVLGKLGEAGVGVLVLNGRQKRPTLMLPNWKLDGLRRMAQYAFSQDADACLAAARHTVSAKLAAQQMFLLKMAAHDAVYAKLLREHSQAIGRMADEAAVCSNMATLRGLEGAAAACYFGTWAAVLPEEWAFTGRNKKPPRDPLNSTLSLVYTLLHFEIVKHLYLSGLDPYIGYYHQVEHGRESLACDLLEYMRVNCDHWAISLFTTNTLTPADFSITARGCYMSKPARILFYQAYDQAAKKWRSQIHQLCMDYLAALARYRKQPDIQMGCLEVIE